MTTGSFATRRALLIGTAGAAMACVLPPLALAESLPGMTVTRDPNCGCCGGWVAHVKTAGFAVEVVEAADVAPLKTRLGVPEALHSCHTAQVAGYVVEGHVPADAIKRLLAERPQATGLAVAGMPVGSPGMEVAGTEPDRYEVILFGPSGNLTFATYYGGRQI